jgi:hypothetical protein
MHALKIMVHIRRDFLLVVSNRGQFKRRCLHFPEKKMEARRKSESAYLAPTRHSNQGTSETAVTRVNVSV